MSAAGLLPKRVRCWFPKNDPMMKAEAKTRTATTIAATMGRYGMGNPSKSIMFNAIFRVIVPIASGQSFRACDLSRTAQGAAV